MILGGLKKQKDNHGGEERVDHILNKYGSSSVLDDIYNDIIANEFLAGYSEQDNIYNKR